jgi:antitoxin MazE
MNLQVSKWGNSLAMRIPSEIARSLGLREGDSVEAQLSVDGALTIRSASWNRRSFAADLDAARTALPMGTSVMDTLRQTERY